MTAGRPTKEELEYMALRAVFDPASFRSIVASDSPDFLIHRGVSNTEFGVEVTELFESEGAARIARQPDYLNQLTGPNPVPHRRDKELEITTVEVTSHDGVVKHDALPVVMMRTPTPGEHWAALSQRIRRKSESAENYRQDLEFIELVVIDHFPRNVYKSFIPSTTDLLTDEMRLALRDSPFEEIHVVWNADKQVSVALRQLHLLEALELFIGALGVFDLPSDPERQLSAEDVIPLFVRVVQSPSLEWLGLLVTFGLVGGIPTAMTKGAGVRFTERGLSVLDPHHSRMPDEQDQIPSTVSGSDFHALVTYFSDYCKNNRLVINYTFAVEWETPLLGTGRGPRAQILEEN